MTNEEIIDAIATKLLMFEAESVPQWETDEEALDELVDAKSPYQMKYFLLDIAELSEQSDSLSEGDERGESEDQLAKTFDPDSVISRHEDS